MRGPVPVALASAAMWGLWWVPIRLLEAAGLGDAWAGLAMNAAALPALAVAALIWRGGGRLSPRAMLGALFVGVAVSLYSGSLAYTEVVRAVLLFYLAPAWSIAIECLFLGRRWGWRSALAIALSLAGMVMILRGEISLAGIGAGDAMALASGVAWSVGAALVFTAPPPVPGAARLALATVLAAVAVGALLALVSGAPPTGIAAGEAAAVGLVSGTLYLAPIMIVTLWAAQRLAPATVSFLLTAEIITGVVSSAILLDERFGLPEVAGALLVTLGATVEVIRPRAAAAPRA